jgi:hypothetical protein
MLRVLPGEQVKTSLNKRKNSEEDYSHFKKKPDRQDGEAEKGCQGTGIEKNQS